MNATVESFNERVLLLGNYSAPLRILSIDNDSGFNQEFRQNLSQIFLLPERQVSDYSRWKDIGSTIVDKLQSDEIFAWLTDRKMTDAQGSLLDNERNQIDSQRQELIKNILRLSENASLYAQLAIRNIVYMASEGSMLFNPYEEEGRLIRPVISRFLFDTLVVNSKIPQDDFSFWLKTTNLLLQPVSPAFKDEFQALFNYEIPYGLSPGTKSDSLGTILSHANKVALLPLIQGANEVGSAIASHHWGVALEAATTSGAVVIIMLTAVAISERIYNWKKSSEKKAPNK
jgi:hypothetical protein